VLGPSPRDGSAEITTVWIYKTGLMFAFKGMATYATATTPGDDRAMVQTLTQAIPVRWDNLATAIVDSMPADVVRFRGGKDSVDILVVAAPPPATAVAGSTNAWLITPNALVIYRDSSELTTPSVRRWSRRVQPGVYIFRAEASSGGPDTIRSARTTNVIDATLSATSGLTARGAAMSDLLLGTSAEMRASGRRWSDVDITPVVGSLPRNSPLAIMWENYELGERDGTAQYDVTITLSRERSAVGRIAASVVGALASAARVEQRGDNVTISFDRNLPHSAAIADAITISMQDTPPGR
jgi:hypothetical protein